MSLLTRKRFILAKLETTYGVDPVPTGADNAMLVKNLNFTPISANTITRELQKGYFGNDDLLLTEIFAQLEFEIELVGSGIKGVAPAWAPLLKACAFDETLATVPLTSITRSGAVATANRTAHGFVVGDRVRISGATEPEYNGTFTVATVPNANSFTYAVTGSPTSPATGTPVIGDRATYEPITEALQSLTFYVNISGVEHKLTGARGSVEFNIVPKEIPVMRFTFTGIYNDPADVAVPVVDFTDFVAPRVANTQNTPDFEIFGYAGCLSSFNLNMNNEITYITRIGCESVEMIDRKPSGTMQVEAPLLATHDFFSDAKNNTTGSMFIVHGIDNGEIVKISAPRVTIGNPTYQDNQGTQELSLPFVPAPQDGNDEVRIEIY